MLFSVKSRTRSCNVGQHRGRANAGGNQCNTVNINWIAYAPTLEPPRCFKFVRNRSSALLLSASVRRRSRLAPGAALVPCRSLSRFGRCSHPSPTTERRAHQAFCPEASRSPETDRPAVFPWLRASNDRSRAPAPRAAARTAAAPPGVRDRSERSGSLSTRGVSAQPLFPRSRPSIFVLFYCFFTFFCVRASLCFSPLSTAVVPVPRLSRTVLPQKKKLLLVGRFWRSSPARPTLPRTCDPHFPLDDAAVSESERRK